MQVMTQLATFLVNRPGTLADVTASLAKNGINILGLTVSDSVDHAVIRVVVDNPTAALHLLGEAGLLVVDTEILAIDLGNAPGRIAEIANQLQTAGVNIEYAYGGVAPSVQSGLIFLRVSDIEKAREALAHL